MGIPIIVIKIGSTMQKYLLFLSAKSYCCFPIANSFIMLVSILLFQHYSCQNYASIIGSGLIILWKLEFHSVVELRVHGIMVELRIFGLTFLNEKTVVAGI